ncbi:unnamed protein product [Lupinus luteus]|uniref:ZF-HD dimerization-type domain-containing protein n=1 Tax=Lupinus luteus TaxID=3873 RepID=A0AAV1XCV7_LUPLU
MEKGMEFGESQNQVQEEMSIQTAPPPENDSLKNSEARTNTSAIANNDANTIPPGRRSGSVIYKECQKNHATIIGGYVFDGCGEFVAAGKEGTMEADICAACNCHRSFHRKEIEGVVNMNSYLHQPWPQPQPQPPLHACYHHMPPPPPVGYHHHIVAASPVSQHRPIALPTASGGDFSFEEGDISNRSNNDDGGKVKKRFRTKFTTEQKDKMLAFAENVGWKIHKHDDNAVEQFCAETGVKKQVLKVWMHNNKLKLGKRS